MSLVMFIMNQTDIENPPRSISGSEPGEWALGAENGVLRRLSAPDSAIRNFVSPVSEFGA